MMFAIHLGGRMIKTALSRPSGYLIRPKNSQKEPHLAVKSDNQMTHPTKSFGEAVVQEQLLLFQLLWLRRTPFRDFATSPMSDAANAHSQ
jgi:hypothetical protein